MDDFSNYNNISRNNLLILFNYLDGRITLKDFERQSSVLLGERVNLLLPFYCSCKQTSTNNDTHRIVELHSEIALFRSKIDELQSKIAICEKSQLLSKQVEMEYEDLIKFINEQLNQFKLNEISQMKQIRANHQLIEKLFHYLTIYLKSTRDEHILSQLKHEYEEQLKYSSSIYPQHSHENFIVENKKYQQRI